MMSLGDDRLLSPAPLRLRVRQWVAGPLDSQIEQALRQVAIDFCRRSALVHLERTFGRVLAGQRVSLTDDASINRQARQRVGAPQVTGSVIHRITAGEECDLLLGGEDYYAVSSDTVLFLRPFTHVTVVGAMEPLPTATVWPAALVEAYADALAEGAAAVLLMQPDRPWSNPQQAQLHQRAFNEALRIAYRWRREQTPAAGIPHPVNRHRTFY